MHIVEIDVGRVTDHARLSGLDSDPVQDNVARRAFDLATIAVERKTCVHGRETGIHQNDVGVHRAAD
jgi:hypothetical protein